MAETKKKWKKKENRFYFKETYLKVFETQSYYPQFVPKSNRDQPKKNPQKELFPHCLFFFFKKQRKRTRVYHKTVVVWAKPQAEVQRWWPTKKVAEGFGNGRHHLGDGFCWRKMWFTEKQ